MKTCLIGGTGRCGTSILRKILSRHSSVAVLPTEHRMSIDPDGLIDFYRNITNVWSPYLADVRLKRLKQFLQDLGYTNPIHKVLLPFIQILNALGIPISPKRYVNIELAQWIPSYNEHVSRLMGELTDFSYKGRRLGSGSYEMNPIISYASPVNRNRVKSIIQSFLRGVIGAFLNVNKKEWLVEANTWNILFAGELLELMPEAKLISMIRDPRDVVASLSQQRWMPNDVIKTQRIYIDLMDKWFQIRDGLPDNSWLEIRLESLVENPEDTLRNVCEFLGLPWEQNLMNVDLSQSNSGRWKVDIGSKEQDILAAYLQDKVEKLGYE